MKLKYTFAITSVCGTWAAAPVGEGAKKYPCLATLNETAATMLRLLHEEISEEELVQRMMAEYDAPEALIRQDVADFIAQLRDQNILME